jgi:2-enoate reductase
MKYLSCTVNPITGMEREYVLTPAAKQKSVLVIGGGPAGLEAARVAALRGHEVCLWEKSAQLGGKMVPASVPDFKQDLRPFIEYLSGQIKKLGVRVELMKEANAEAVEHLSPEVVIVATGAIPLIPPIMGIGGNNVFTALDILLGKNELGSSVVVVGGGLVGCEVAVYLQKKGKSVTIIEMMKRLVPEEINVNSRMGLMDMVTESRVKVLTDTKLLEVMGQGIFVNAEGAGKKLKADSVVLAVGFKPESTLRDELEGRVPELFAVGDCVEPRKIINAIWEGFHTSRLI